MIDNFAPQPYPLECCADGETWLLVLGWQRSQTGDLTPVVAAPAGGVVPVGGWVEAVRYRLADTRPVAPRPTASPSARVEPRRERGA